jgi:hypothetical protein
MNDKTSKALPESLNSMAISGPDVKRSFDQNYLDILQRIHHDLPIRYLVDFLHKAQLSGADPRLNQIHLTSYYSNKLNSKVGVTVFSYHFFLNQANQTGEMLGLNVNSEVESVFNPLTGEESNQLVATATVERKGRGKTIFKARWKEFYNQQSPQWKEKPYVMLEKTAIANVLRWAFPEALSGMFISEEINEEHIDQAAEESWKSEVIEITGKKINESKIESELIKSGSSKSDLFEQIKFLIDERTKGMKAIEKGQWIYSNIKVRNVAEIKIIPLSDQQKILDKLKNELSEKEIIADNEKKDFDESIKDISIKKIRDACSKLTSGFDDKQKMEFITSRLKVEKFSDLKSLSLEQLNSLVLSLGEES